MKTKTAQLFQMLRKGWVSHEDAFMLGITTLSQRCSEFRADLHHIVSRPNKHHPRRFDYRLIDWNRPL